ncbi:hypothetical protein [Amycolatopsis sp. H20-H5]|uniref:hypothetical protein n=1 Tax=Amycolatopsis sp. H20-H5 TaxID=3046309 RepID=UPI002DB66F56|nr:hypothetical protein [Amycolatopsis sp. H20-H5]MEC3974839.1 hypothetical protein [Amycolatopsis sp. H20-H5]
MAIAMHFTDAAEDTKRDVDASAYGASPGPLQDVLRRGQPAGPFGTRTMAMTIRRPSALRCGSHLTGDTRDVVGLFDRATRTDRA